MTSYGSWRESLTIGGETFRADLVDDAYAGKAGVARILAVNGLPALFEGDLVRASQVCDVPHTWRIKEFRSEEEVTPEVLEQGKAALHRDRRELNAHIITYLGDREGNGDLEFLAAGAVRNKLTRDFESAEFPVVSRAIVAPRHRGKGLGSLIVEHRMKIILAEFFGIRPKAIHFGTESKKILHSVKKVEQAIGANFVYIGDEKYTASDGTHTVHDFLCFLPWYRRSLAEACDALERVSGTPAAVAEFRRLLMLFAERGIEGTLGAALEESFHAARKSLSVGADSENAADALRRLEEVFFIKRKIGASDPEERSASHHI